MNSKAKVQNKIIYTKKRRKMINVSWSQNGA
jgi:hypothetical protein